MRHACEMLLLTSPPAPPAGKLVLKQDHGNWAVAVLTTNAPFAWSTVEQPPLLMLSQKRQIYHPHLSDKSCVQEIPTNYQRKQALLWDLHKSR